MTSKGNLSRCCRPKKCKTKHCLTSGTSLGPFGSPDPSRWRDAPQSTRCRRGPPAPDCQCRLVLQGVTEPAASRPADPTQSHIIWGLSGFRFGYSEGALHLPLSALLTSTRQASGVKAITKPVLHVTRLFLIDLTWMISNNASTIARPHHFKTNSKTP